MSQENMIENEVAEEQSVDTSTTEQPGNAAEAQQEVSLVPQEAQPEEQKVVNEDDDPIERSKAFKKRIDRLERKHQRQMQQMMQANQAQMAQILASVLPPKQESPYGVYNMPPVVPENSYNPYGAQPQNVDVNMAVKEYMRQQEEQKQRHEEQQAASKFQEQVERLMDDNDDYLDVVQKVDPHLTPSMRQALIQLSSLHDNAIENVYQVAKEDPARFARIAALSPQKQVLEMGRIDAEMNFRRQQKNNTNKPVVEPKKQEAPKPQQGTQPEEPEEQDLFHSVRPPVKRPLTPTKSTGTFRKNPLDMTLEDMLAPKK